MNLEYVSLSSHFLLKDPVNDDRTEVELQEDATKENAVKCPNHEGRS